MFNYTRWVLAPLGGIALGLVILSLASWSKPSAGNENAKKMGYRDSGEVEKRDDLISHLVFGKKVHLDPEGLRIAKSAMESGSDQLKSMAVGFIGQLTDIDQMRDLAAFLPSAESDSLLLYATTQSLTHWCRVPDGRGLVESLAAKGSKAAKDALAATESGR